MKNILYPNVTVEQLQAGIDAKHIKVETAEVTIGSKSSPTGKDESQAYDKLVALDAEGMALLCGGKIEPATPAPAEGKDERTPEQKSNGAADHFNYGFDLSARQKVRAELAERIEGPSKVIAKTADQLVKAGLYETLDEAIAAVKAQRAAKGLAV